MSDFNSRGKTRGYADTNDDGVAVEKWAEDNEISLIHYPKLPHSFNSSRWKREYNPEILFVSNNIKQQAIKNVNKPIIHSQHYPVFEHTHRYTDR